MKVKTLGWFVLFAIVLGAVLLFNYSASFEPLSLMTYSGFVLALVGLSSLAIPFRFLGVHKRSAGALIFAGGVVLAIAALLWPAPVIRVAQHKSRLDDIMPEYEFSEKHSVSTRARPEQVLQAAREATWGDLSSLNTLMKIRGAVLRAPFHATGYFAPDKRVLDVFAASGYLTESSGHELVVFGAANTRLRRGTGVHSAQEFVDYREQGAVKIAFDFTAEDAGGGWTTITTETRMMVHSDSTRGAAIYWRLIVPGSGLLRREWLDGIKRRAESGH